LLGCDVTGEICSFGWGFLRGRKVDERSPLEANEVDEEAPWKWIGTGVCCRSCNSIGHVLHDVGKVKFSRINVLETHASYMHQEVPKGQVTQGIGMGLKQRTLTSVRRRRVVVTSS